MTRNELEALASFLRARLGTPASNRLTCATASGCLRTVEQALLGLEGYLELEAQQPPAPGLAIEGERAQALWQTLQNMAALWADHPDSRTFPPAPPNPGAPPAAA